MIKFTETENIKEMSSYLSNKTVDGIFNDFKVRIAPISDIYPKVEKYGSNVGTVIREVFYDVIYREIGLDNNEASKVFNKFLNGFKNSL